MDARLPSVQSHCNSAPHGLFYQPFWILKKGRELVETHHHDVMTVHDYPPFYNGHGAQRLQRKIGIPCALEVHHIVGYPRAGSIVELVGRWMSRWCLPCCAKSAKALRCVSRAVASVLEKWGIPKEKIHIVPSFYLDREALQPDPRVEKKYDIVFCARLVANKGLGELLKALTLLPGVRLLIVGSEPGKSSVDASSQWMKLAKKLGVSDRVVFRGWLEEQSDVYRSLQEAKVFVMNSKSEGGPRVSLEAMALGIPVLSTKVGVMPDVIEDGVNGIFTNGEPDDLAQKIKRLLGDEKERERMRSEARKILDRFERRTLIKGYADFLKDLV